MRSKKIFRRLRLLRASIQNQFKPSIVPTKHVKIDDEENLLEFYDTSFEHHRRQSSIITMLKILIVILLFLLVLAYTIYKPPRFVTGYLQRRYPDVLFEIDIASPQRVVALTLDDAPSVETSKILDLLKKYNAKATFFVIGSQIGGREDLLKRMHHEGHEIGNHAWADEPSINLPLVELEQQIKKVENLLPSNPNGVRYFRPGSGFFNSQLVRMVRGLGYQVVLGGIYPHDPQIHNPRWNANHVLSMVRPGGIIIMHDRRSYSANQLELVLQGLTKNGWNIESLGGLIKVEENTRMQGGVHSFENVT